MLRRLHLISGLVLFTFVAMHLLNHALGLISLAALEEGQYRFFQIWRNPVGTSLLYGALILHIAFVIKTIFERRVFRMSQLEWVQLILGITVPLLLIPHVIHTRAAYEIFGYQDTYTRQLYVYFIAAPELIYRQMFLAIVAWTHGSIGLHQWLKMKPAYRRREVFALLFALAVPALSLAGVWTSGRDIAHLAENPAWTAAMRRPIEALQENGLSTLLAVEDWLTIIFITLIALTFALRPLVHFIYRRLGLVRLNYPGNGQVMISKGTSVLEASRENNIPHASVCGGRGRCSTCRIRVSGPADKIAKPSASEAEVLQRIGAADNIRLACQFRPIGDCTVEPILHVSTASQNLVGHKSAYTQGTERDIVVLFADIRGFTSLSEGKLPFDVVFLLNRYFATMGQSIISTGGHVDKFIGDGVMALFGLESSYEEACRSALNATVKIAEELNRLNEMLTQELDEPLRLAIGLHGGAAIMGEMGHGEASGLTAVGDTVNTASRLEAIAKSYDVQLVVSESVALGAKVDLSRFETEDVAIRGRREHLIVHRIDHASALAGIC